METGSSLWGSSPHKPFPCVSGDIALSRQARSLWGKSDGGEGACWLPLYMHMLDSAGIAGCLWDKWLPEGTRALFVQALGGDPCCARKLACFIAGIHDIGKTKELSVFPENDYTDDGQLLGHIIIGTEMVSERMRTIEGFPPKLATELKHCILAHHGELEYGSPKKPALLEAMALNFADNADAKMETMIEVLRGAGDNQGWLGYNRLLETNIRKTTEY